MKKGKLKSLVTSARKAAKKDIEQRLIAELNKATEELGQDSKKLKKKIEKGAGQLSKQLSKALKFDKSVLSAEVVASPAIEVEEPA